MIISAVNLSIKAADEAFLRSSYIRRVDIFFSSFIYPPDGFLSRGSSPDNLRPCRLLTFLCFRRLRRDLRMDPLPHPLPALPRFRRLRPVKRTSVPPRRPSPPRPRSNLPRFRPEPRTLYPYPPPSASLH